MKKKLALLLAGMMAAGTCMAGCGSSSTESASGSSGTAAESTQETTSASAGDDSASAAETTADSGVLKVAAPQCSTSLSPVTGYDYWYLVRYGICETLMGFNEDMTPYCWLAEDYKMDDDQLTWTFTIRDDVVFSNGEKLTAEIAKACIERAFEESNTAATYFSYDSIEADGQNLIIKTSEPTPTLPYIMADPVFVMYDATADLTNEAEEGVIGTGPFVAESFTVETGDTVVVKNDNYWGGDVALDEIDFTIIKDTSTLDLSLQNGEIDAAYAIDFSIIDKYEENADYTVESVASGRTDFCFMNQNEGKALEDETLRQAIMRACDRETYCTYLLNGQFVAGKTPITSSLSYGYDELEDINAYDTESAEKLLDDAGYVDKDGDGYRENPDGEALDIGLTIYDSRAEIPVLAQQMQIDLEAIGIKVTINDLDQSTAWNMLTTGEYDMLMMSISMTNSGDPEIGLKSYFTTYNEKNNANYNMSGYSDEKVDSLMEELSQEFDLDKRIELVKEVEQQLMDDSACFYLCYPMLNFVVKSNVKGVTSHPSDYYWVSKDTCIE